MQPDIAVKLGTLLDHRKQQTEWLHSTLRSARSEVQRMVGKCANDCWLNLCKAIKNVSDTSNISAMYDGIEKSLDPCTVKTAPVRSSSGNVLMDRSEQILKWVEHFQDLYARENSDAYHSCPSWMSFMFHQPLKS